MKIIGMILVLPLIIGFGILGSGEVIHLISEGLRGNSQDKVIAFFLISLILATIGVTFLILGGK